MTDVHTSLYDKTPKQQRPTIGPSDITWLRKTIADCQKWGKHKAAEALTEALMEAEAKQANTENNKVKVISR